MFFVSIMHFHRAQMCNKNSFCIYFPQLIILCDMRMEEYIDLHNVMPNIALFNNVFDNTGKLSSYERKQIKGKDMHFFSTTTTTRTIIELSHGHNDH